MLTLCGELWRFSLGRVFLKTEKFRLASCSDCGSGLKIPLISVLTISLFRFEIVEFRSYRSIDISAYSSRENSVTEPYRQFLSICYV
jgi:hypothetical protein